MFSLRWMRHILTEVICVYENESNVPAQKTLIAGGSFLLVLILLTGIFFWYVSDYYRAEDVALEVMTQDSNITVQDNLTILSPTYPTDTAIIFTPAPR